MQRNKENGFTIIEIIIAITLFAIIVPSIVGMITTAGYINKKSIDYTLVNNMAEEKIESLRSKGYAALADGTTDFSNELPGTLTPPNSASYTITPASTDVKKVEVSISYTSQGEQKTFSYTSYISKNGLGQ